MTSIGGRLAIGAIAVVALAAGLYLGLKRADPDSTRPVSTGAVSTGTVPAGSASKSAQAPAQFALTDLQLPDLNGMITPLESWSGKVLVVNFWATWCGPCREEMPAFADIQRQFRANGVLFVGIGIDSADKMKIFADSIKVDYTLLVGDGGTLDLMRRLGNRSGALPFTIIVDRAGNIVERHLGVVETQTLEARLRGLTS